MNILGKLAFSQIRRKKTRTWITILAIVLSSSLLTAVVNFVASGNAMLVAFLGDDYGMYGGAYMMLLLIPAVILGGLIIAMSVIVISNVFRMSANERVTEFGALKCVGATKKQIYRTIMYECLFLCSAAIPFGVMLGYLLSFWGIQAANTYTEELNVLVRAMMVPVTFEISFVFSPAALLVSVIISAGTAAFSAMIPARKAMGLPALECLRSGGEAKTVYKRTKMKLSGKVNPEYQLARKNIASGSKKMKSAVTAFSISILLFVTMGGLKAIADGVSDYIYVDLGYTMMADYTSNYDYEINEKTGRRECFYVQTIDNTLAQEITEELAAYGNMEIYGMGQDYFTYVTALREDELTEEMREALAYLGEGEIEEDGGNREGAVNGEAEEENAAAEGREIEIVAVAGREAENAGTEEREIENATAEEREAESAAVENGKAENEKRGAEYELRVELIIVDEAHYQELCEQAGIAYGGVILLNDYKYNYRGSEKHIVPFPASLSSLELEKADGTCETVEVDGILAMEKMPKEFFYPNTNPVRLVVPYAEVRGYTWMASPEDEGGYIEYAKSVLEKHFPQGGLEYGEAGFVSRVFGAQDFARIMNIAIVLASVFLYGFVLLLGVIGMLNVISTMLFDVKMRAREFAVLQSIGMTYESLRKMLYLESVFCAGKAVAGGLPAGILLVMLMKYCVQKVFPIPFEMPWGTIVCAAAVSFLLTGGTVRVTLNALKKQNVIETIRM